MSLISPLYSIVTVCRDASATIASAAISLREQTHSNYEWIVVDGASTDGTGELVRRFLHSHDLIVSEPDQGIYDAMNRGLNFAKGRYVYFLNADDAFVGPNVLEDVSKELEEGMRLIYGNVVLWDPVTNLSARISGSFRSIHAVSCRLPHHQACFFSRQWLQSVGGFSLDFGLSGDIDLIGRSLSDPNRWRRIDVDIARFRLGGASYNRPLAIKTLRDRARAVRSAFGFWVGVCHRLFLGYYVPKMILLGFIRGGLVDRLWRGRRMRAQGLYSR